MNLLLRPQGRCAATIVAVGLLAGNLGAESQTQSEPGVQVGHLALLLGVARGPAGSAFMASLSRPDSSAEFRIGGLLLESPDDRKGQWLDFGTAKPGGVASVALTEEAAIVAVARVGAGKVEVLSYELRSGHVDSWEMPGIRSRPAFARRPEGGLYLAWLDPEGASSTLWLQSLDPRGKRVGPATSVGLGRGAPGELSLLSTRGGKLYVVWSEPVNGRDDSSGKALWACDLSAQERRIERDCPVPVTHGEERALGRFSAECALDSCWVLWFDGAVRLRLLDFDREMATEPPVVTASSGRAIRLPTFGVSQTGVLVVWNESVENRGWELRAKWVDTRNGGAAALASSARPWDSPWLEAAGGASDVLVAWIDDEHMLRHRFVHQTTSP